ncbi:hypothetical protein ACFL1Z_02235 [Thermodesulfobacteriota bacterium]
MKSSDKRLTLLQGIIIPVEWDDNGNITAIALSTYDEEEYIISNDEKFEELVKILRQEVKLTGDIIIDHKKKSIFVHSYMLKSNSSKEA